MAFFSGLAFFDGNTVLPVFLARLGAADWIVGLTRLIQTLGYTLPALISAHHIHGRPRHKSYLLLTCYLSRIGLFTLPPVFLLCARGHPTFVLVWLLCVLGVFWTLDGACAVSWYDIVAKTIPARVRGRFFGLMQTLGGIAGILVGKAVATILAPGGLRFPANFAVLAGGWCVGIIGSQIGLHLLREPEGDVEPIEERPSFVEYVRQAPALLRRSPGVVRILVARLVLDGTGMAAPFYVLFATRDLRISLATVGLYQLLQSAGRVSTGPLWGWISDRWSPVIGLRIIAVFTACVPALALAAGHGAAWVFPVVFFVLGAIQDGLWMVTTNALLETVGERDRPLAIGVLSLGQTPVALYGPLGGLIAEATSYATGFGVALCFGIAGTLLVLRIRPPSRSQ